MCVWNSNFEIVRHQHRSTMSLWSWFFFFTLHKLSHLVVNASIKLMTDRFFGRTWSRIRSFERMLEDTLKYPQDFFPSPDERFTHLRVDITRPLPSYEECSLLTSIDLFFLAGEKYPTWYTFSPVLRQKNYFLTDILFQYPICCFHRKKPANRIWYILSLMKHLGIKRILTTHNHPEENGMADRFHCRLKSSLKASLIG